MTVCSIFLAIARHEFGLLRSSGATEVAPRLLATYVEPAAWEVLQERWDRMVVDQGSQDCHG